MKLSETLPTQGGVAQEAGGPRWLRAKFWWRVANFALGLLVSGLCLYMTLRGVDLARVWQRLQSAQHMPLVLAMCVGVVSNLIRAVRWGVLLGPRPPVRLRFLFTSMMIGYTANNVLPARMGELVRIYVLERKARVSKSTAAATIVLERLTDALVLLALLGLLSFFVPLPAMIRNGSLIAATVFLTIAMVLVFVALKGESLMRRLQGMLSAWRSLGRTIQGVLERFIVGLSVLRSGRQALLVLALTLLVWGLEAISVGLVMGSLDLSLPRIAALFVLVVLSLSFVIPAAPGAVGTYEFFTVAALSPFAVKGDQAVGMALVLHAVAYITSTAIGLVCLWVESLSLNELMSKVNITEQEKT